MKYNLKGQLFLFTFSLSISTLLAQKFEAFQMNGSNKSGKEKAYIMYYPISETPTVVDAASVNQTKFSFSGRVEGPSYAGIRFGNDYPLAYVAFKVINFEILRVSLVGALPSNSLRDPKGRIIANNLGDEKLSTFLEKTIN